MGSKLFTIALAAAIAFAACGGGDDSGLAEPALVATSSVTTVPPGSAGTTTTQAAATTTTSLVPIEELGLALETVAEGFEAPVFVASPPGDSRLFVLDQPGVIWVIDGGESEAFLDLRDSVVYGGEQGLLGLAFHPDFAGNGRFFVNYTGGRGETTVAEFIAAGNAADPASRRIILTIDQPASNHNGGMLAFGPDGYLWIGMGDGGSRDDRFDNAQDATTLLGAMLRIDVDPAGGGDDGRAYAIPPDNPFADGDGGDPAVWAIGLRNPWRFSFDGEDLWIGDVGQNAWEEIDVVSASDAGLNFGWPRFEATHCYLDPACDESGLVAPVYEYGHEGACSITGGYVYRGGAIPELDGHYFFGDYCAGWIRSLSPAGEVTEWLPGGTVPALSSFGFDAAGELHVTSLSGFVAKLTRSGEA